MNSKQKEDVERDESCAVDPCRVGIHYIVLHHHDGSVELSRAKREPQYPLSQLFCALETAVIGKGVATGLPPASVGDHQ
jgi:hypothetical protein